MDRFDVIFTIKGSGIGTLFPWYINNNTNTPSDKYIYMLVCVCVCILITINTHEWVPFHSSFRFFSLVETILR